jgi:hypothetical protein
MGVPVTWWGDESAAGLPVNALRIFDGTILG